MSEICSCNARKKKQRERQLTVRKQSYYGAALVYLYWRLGFTCVDCADALHLKPQKTLSRGRVEHPKPLARGISPASLALQTSERERLVKCTGSRYTKFANFIIN